jgi:hypothetical protein
VPAVFQGAVTGGQKAVCTIGSMAVTAKPTLNAHKLRADYPVFDQPIHGKPLAFLDSAVTSQKPHQVLDAMRDFYATSYSNVHRGVRARDRGVRRGSRQGACVHQRTVDA